MISEDNKLSRTRKTGYKKLVKEANKEQKKKKEIKKKGFYKQQKYNDLFN